MHNHRHPFRLFATAVAFLCLCASAAAGPITYLAPPAVSSTGVLGGAFLPTSPPSPGPGNPPLASLASLVVLPAFGFTEGIRTIGTLDFVAVGGSATVNFVALRPFQVGNEEDDLLAVAYNVAYWSNNAESAATRTSYNAETFVPGIGLVGVGATVAAAVPFNALTSHPPRPLFGTTLNDVAVNLAEAEAAAGTYIMIQRVQIDFAGLAPGEIIRIDVLPVESSIRGEPDSDVPEPGTHLLYVAGVAMLMLLRAARAA